MDAQRIAIDAVVALTDCDREQVTAFIRRLYLAGVKDPKRLTSRVCRRWRRAERQRSLDALESVSGRSGDRPEETVDLGLKARGRVRQLLCR